MDVISGKITNLLPFDGVREAFGFQSEGGERMTVVLGPLPDEFVPKEGAEIVVAGRSVSEGNFGAVVAQVVKRRSPRMMAEFLAARNIPGIAKARARSLVEIYKEKLDLILLCQPHLLEGFPGIEQNTTSYLKAAWKDHRRRIDLFEFLSKAGLESYKIKKIERVSAGDGLAGYDENPYKITAAKGITFEDADKIAFSMLKFKRNDPLRIRAALKITMDKIKNDGLCGLPRSTLIDRARRELGGPTVDEIKAQIAAYIEDGHFVAKERGRDVVIYPMSIFNKELNIARDLVSRIENPAPDMDISEMILDVEDRIGVKLAEAQRLAVEMVFSSRISIITGGPGVGKTTTLKTILGVIHMIGGDKALASPTGAAAKRMSQATGNNAKTIHRMLKFRDGRFTHDRSNPIEPDYVFIDEHSMTDIDLLDALMSGVGRNARLVFIGDVDQLPSVGSGRVLNDMIDSGIIPVTRLDVIYRQGENSRITEVAHAINEGKCPDLEDRDGSDFSFLQADKVEDVLNGLVKAVAENIPGKLGFDPVRDIQVICPQKIGPIGSLVVNKLLRERLNPQGMKIVEDIRARFGDKRAEESFVPGDKVIQMRNNKEKEIFNGEIGFVLERRKADILVQFDDRVLSYDYNSQDQIQLAYAITVHKSQGSESPVIVMPVHSENRHMLQRNLVYTGITRGKDYVMIIGEQSALKKAARTDRSNDRYSLLADNLVDLARLSPALTHLELKDRVAGPDIDDEAKPVVLENEGMGLFG